MFLFYLEPYYFFFWQIKKHVFLLLFFENQTRLSNGQVIKRMYVINICIFWKAVSEKLEISCSCR